MKIDAINKKIIKIEIFRKDFKEWDKVKIYLEDGNIIDISFWAEYASDTEIEVKVIPSK